jgi:hypothetical protein
MVPQSCELGLLGSTRRPKCSDESSIAPREEIGARQLLYLVGQVRKVRRHERASRLSWNNKCDLGFR